MKIESLAASARDGKIEIENLQGQIKQYLKNYTELTNQIAGLDIQSKEWNDYSTAGSETGGLIDTIIFLKNNVPDHVKAKKLLKNKRAEKQKLEKNIFSALSTQKDADLKSSKEYNRLIKQLEDSVDIYQSNQQHLIEFRTNCAAEAVDYLKHNKNNIDNINKGKYKDKGNCKKVDKLLFACLVAAKSSSVKDRKIGFSSFSKIQKAATF